MAIQSTSKVYQFHSDFKQTIDRTKECVCLNAFCLQKHIVMLNGWVCNASYETEHHEIYKQNRSSSKMIYGLLGF